MSVRVSKMIVVSSDHLDEEGRRFLTRQLKEGPSEAWVIPHDYGHMVHVPEGDEWPNVSSSVIDLFNLARREGAGWVFIDCDEPVTDELIDYTTATPLAIMTHLQEKRE